MTRARAAVVAGVLVTALAGCDLGAAPTTHPAPGEVVGAGDVNGDGFPDIVTSGNGTEFGVLFGDGSGGFAPVSLIPHVTSCQTGDTEWWTCDNIRVRDVVDVNADGLVDVVYSYDFATNYPPPNDEAYTSWKVRVAHGAGGFTTMHLPESGARTLSIGDVTGDGIPDRVTTGDPFTDPWTLRVGNLTSDLSSLGYRLGDTELGDVNGDGLLDVLIDGTCFVDIGLDDDGDARACVDVALSDGTGAYGAFTRLMVADPRADIAEAVVADVTEDGHPDVLAATAAVLGGFSDGGDPMGALSVFPGDGTGTFGPEITVPAFTQTTGVQPADFDGDGHLDLLTDTDNGNTDQDDDHARVMFGDGQGGFVTGHVVSIDGGVVADLDLDGRPDLASTNDRANVSVYLNRWDGRPD